MRAARLIWAKLIKQFDPKKEKSMALRTHSQTSGWSLTEQDPYNNIARTTLEALSAVLGGTQSLHTNSLDEAIALPTEFSARIARNTQLYLQEEIGITPFIDPCAGSKIIEEKTAALIEETFELIEEVERLGGMTKAIEAGIPKMRIEEAAANKQSNIDSEREIIIGVNRYQLSEEAPIDTLEIDNESVKKQQIERLNLLKSTRDESKVQESLRRLTYVASTSKGNLLQAAIECAKNRATLGEISLAMEEVFGRYTAKTHAIKGIYEKGMKKDEGFEMARRLADEFAESEGRRPRIMIAKMGQDGHDRGAKIIATAFADIGFDVDIGPLFQTPYEVAKQAIENDVHVLGVSSLAAGHKTLIPEVINELKNFNRQDIMVIAGGVIPAKDYEFLYEHGVFGIFGPGTKISKAAIEILQLLIKSNEY